MEYRVWDVEKSEFIDGVYLGPDGYLYEYGGYRGMDLIYPEWFAKETIQQFKNRGEKTIREVALARDNEVRAHQGEWYIVEEYTGYLAIDDTPIYEGDIVQVETEYVVAWGHFDDCCVEGDTWLLLPYEYQPALGHYCNNEDKESRKVMVIGNRHQHPKGVK